MLSKRTDPSASKDSLSSNDESPTQTKLLSDSFDYINSDITYQNEMKIETKNTAHSLAMYFFKYVMLEQAIPESDMRRTSRHFAIAVALFIASLSGVPYINPSRDALGEYETLGWIAAGTTIISFGAGSTWAWLNIMSELDPLSPEEIALYNGKHSRIVRILFANILGALATLPPAYAVYKFNNNIVYPIIAFSAGVATNIYALYKLYDGKKILNQSLRFLRKYHSQKSSLDFELELIDSLGAIIERTPILFLNVPKAQRSVIMPSLFKQSLTNAQDEFIEFIKEAIQLSLLNKNSSQSEDWLDGWPRLLFKLLSAIFPIAFSIVNANLSYESSVLIYNEILFNIAYVILTVVPYMSIEFMAAAKTFESIFDQSFNLVTAQEKKSLPRYYYPLTNISALLISSVLGLIPSASRIYITMNTINGAGQLPLTVIGAMGGTIFQSYVLFDLSHKMIIHYSQLQTKNLEQKQIANLVKRIDKFMQIYENCDINQRNALISETKDLRNLLLDYNETIASDKSRTPSPSGYETIETHVTDAPIFARPRRESSCDKIISYFFRPASFVRHENINRVSNESRCRIC
jgi:hypothetical protein